MDLLWMVLLLVLVGAEAQNLTNVTGILGKDVILNCSIRNNEVHWSMEIYSQLKVCIGQTYNDESSLCSPGLESKYLISGNRLVIKNMTSGDQRRYFCGGRINGSIRFVETFNLVSDSPLDSDQQNQMNHTNFTDLCSFLQRKFLFFSLSLNGVLGLVVVGLSCFLFYFKRKNSKQQEDNPETFTCENPEPAQYEEIRFPTSRVAAASDAVYYKVQLPQC